MRYFEAVKQAFEILKMNKARSILTMLGIIMGVFSIITIIAIGNAAQAFIMGQFDRMGNNAIDVVTTSAKPEDQLKLDDMEIIKAAVPEMENIEAFMQGQGTIIDESEDKDILAIVFGVTSQWRNIVPMEMAAGRFINDLDVSIEGNYVVVDDASANRLFNQVDITGQTLSFRNMTGEAFELMVVGVFINDDPFAAMAGDNYPALIYLPITTVQNIFNTNNIDSIKFSVDSEVKDLPQIGDRVIRALEFVKGSEGIYMASSMADYQEQISVILVTLSSVFLVIAIITLIVGGIGIVNILLVSVAERVREIGIRKALGAQKRDIIIQFMAESIIITGIGGVIGIILGLFIGGVVSSLINIPPVVNFSVVVLALLIAVVLGMVFGVYPAKKAADLNPIEALRHEI